MTDQGQSLIKDTLSNLTDIAETVRTNPQAQAPQDLAKVKKIKNDLECDDNASAKLVMKVLALAVNEAIQQKVNLSEINTDDVKKQFKELLEIPSAKSLRDYFVDPAILSEAKSPLDMAKNLKKDVPQWLAKNIIRHQFDIRWCTDNGKHVDYKFYQFCDMKNTTSLLKYKPRAAHVKATLYKECRSIYDAQSIIEYKEQLCPTVYIKTNCGWRTWQADEDKFTHVGNITDDLSWIDKDIRQFITENADVQRGDLDESLKNSLKKPTLYWAVLKDKDFIRGGEKLKLESISETQVYVGKAKNGIQGRWIDGDNHCEMMKKCLDNVFAMTTYDPLRLKGIQLVDARLALAKVRGEETALFVMKTFGDDVEKAKMELRASLDKVREYFATNPHSSRGIEEIDGLYSKICGYEQKIFGETTNVFSDNAEISSDEAHAELDTIEKYLDTTGEYLDTVQVSSRNGQDMIKKLQEELDEAKECVEDLRNGSKENKRVAEDLLKEAEKQHRKGKTILNKRLNIIPSGVLRAKGRWQPKDMRYGMNFC